MEKKKTIFDRITDRKIIAVNAKSKLAEAEAERQKNILKAKPELWQIPQPKTMMKFLRWRERIPLKIRTWGFLQDIPILNRFAIKTPLYYVFIFFPNRKLGLMAIPQNLQNDTLPLKTRTMQINNEKIWNFGSDSAMFFAHDNAEPLDVEKTKMGVKTINPVIYKKNLENTHISQLLMPQEPAVSNKIILIVLIVIGVIAAVLLAKQMGWI